MDEPRNREGEQARIEGEIADVCGILNAATGRLVDPIARALETGTCEGEGIHSAEQSGGPEVRSVERPGPQAGGHGPAPPGTARSVGRARRIVPERTRIAVEERDGACRVPGCERTRWLQVHHVLHWEDGGATDTDNLIAVCSRHHRLHHLGRLHISAHADQPDGMVFADARGRRLTGCGRPAPPGRLEPSGNWVHPTGERLDMRWLHFPEPPQPLERSLVPT